MSIQLRTMNSLGVTVCLTSCDRHDLLRQTLESFHRFNTFEYSDFYIFEDSENTPSFLEGEFPRIKLLTHGKRIGQIKAIDEMYAKVSTAYIMHVEDDWEFIDYGFIENSIKILERFPNIFTVWLRAEDDTNGHPLESDIMEIDEIKFRILKRGFHDLWHGFTFNPGVRRLSEYVKIGSYSLNTQFAAQSPLTSEAALGNIYDKLGYRAAIILGNGYVRHIGAHRHVY